MGYPRAWPCGPGAGQPLARGWPSWGGTSLGRVYTWDPHMGIPYNARARNVRACPRARARGMNPVSYTHLTLPTTVRV